MAPNPQTDACWWRSRWAVAAIIVATTIPLWWPSLPPLVDVPGHMGRYRVELDLGQDWFAGWYRFEWALIGNLGIDLLVVPLAPLFGLELAVKLIVMTIPALTATGLLWIAREWHGRIPATAPFALPLAYGFPFQFGFVNFALAMALALNAFALWLHLARRDRIRLRALIFVPLSAAIWLCHAYGWGVLGILAFSVELVRQRPQHRWPAALVRAGLGCLPLCLPLALMVAWRSGNVAGATFDWFDWRLKWRWLTMMLRDRWPLFDLVSTGMIALLLLKALRDRMVVFRPAPALSAALLTIAYVVMPRMVFGSEYADMRLAPYVVMLWVLAIGERDRPSPAQFQPIAVVALAFLALRLVMGTASYALYAQDADRQLRALDHIPPHARVLGMLGRSCGEHWAMSRQGHLPAMVIVRKRGYSNGQWQVAGSELLTVIYARAGDFAHNPSQIVTRLKCPHELWKTLDQSLAQFPRDAFDYVWLISPPPYDPRLAADLIPVWRSGSSILYRVPHRAAAPANGGKEQGR